MKTLVNKKVLAALTDAEVRRKHGEYFRLGYTYGSDRMFQFARVYLQEIEKRWRKQAKKKARQ